LSLPDFEDYRRESSTLAGLAVFTNWTANLTGVGSPERLEYVPLKRAGTTNPAEALSP